MHFGVPRVPWLGLAFSPEDMDNFEELLKPVIWGQGRFKPLSGDLWVPVGPKHARLAVTHRRPHALARTWMREMGYLTASQGRGGGGLGIYRHLLLLVPVTVVSSAAASLSCVPLVTLAPTLSPAFEAAWSS